MRIPPKIVTRQEGTTVWLYDGVSGQKILAFLVSPGATHDDNTKMHKSLLRLAVNYANTVHARVHNIR